MDLGFDLGMLVFHCSLVCMVFEMWDLHGIFVVSETYVCFVDEICVEALSLVEIWPFISTAGSRYEYVHRSVHALQLYFDCIRILYTFVDLFIYRCILSISFEKNRLIIIGIYIYIHHLNPNL